MGFLSSYQKYAVSITDAPEIFSEFLAMATAGVIISRSRYLQFGNDELFPNVWILILAPSSFYRKSTALNISSKCIHVVKPLCIYPSEFSHEKILEVIQANPQGVFYYYEFKTLMGILNRDYMQGTKAFLTEIFDNPGTYTRSTKKGGNLCIENPCVSLLSATTSDWFINSIKSGDLEGGFLGRFLFVNADTKIRNDAIPLKLNKDIRAGVYSALSELMEKTKDQKGEMDMSKEAERLYHDWYYKFITKIEEISFVFRPIFARMNIYCLKIAMIIETCNTLKLEISAETMESAIQKVDSLFDSTLELCETDIAFSRSETSEKKILKILKYSTLQPKEMTRTQLLRSSHLSSREFSDVIQTLVDKELVKTYFEKKAGVDKRVQIIILLDQKI
ncbi:MAG: DUF3987 domain-containing protein [Elusimicrobiota bacterium]